ncbi:hypothetical protein [Archangium sp.]|uniref:hypothetical protein n=1 Tax=Archangium sp. TaxID=1872627 RepID=UPI002E300548|nr:hypothetical protein [Archangium sp.]
MVLFTPHYLVAPWVLASTGLIVALPERVARRFAEAFPLTVVPVERPHEPLRVQQLWHPHRQQEPAHRWLREQVLAAARASPVSTAPSMDEACTGTPSAASSPP